jgi:hypothetical protein
MGKKIRIKTIKRVYAYNTLVHLSVQIKYNFSACVY